VNVVRVGLLGTLRDLGPSWVRALVAGSLRFLMAFCDQCYESVSLCQRAGNSALTCTFIVSDPLATRTPEGLYPASLRNTLPALSRNVDGPHIDALVSYAPTATSTTLSAAENAMAGDLNTITTANANVGVSLARKRPDLRQGIIDALNALVPGASAAVIAGLTHHIHQIREEARDLKAASTTQASTASGYQQQVYPRATLFQTLVKGVVRGTEVQEDATVAFDPTTGKKYIPFEKVTKVSSSAQLMYAMSLYVTTELALKGEAPRVYFDFQRDICHVCDHNGFVFAQKYIDAILRYLDEGRFANMVALYRTGEYTRIHQDLVMELRVKTKDPDIKKTNKTMKFIVPTTPLGGKSAGIIKTKCNCFHAVPQRPCSAGVPPFNVDGSANKPEHVGLCAYLH
jgi:hypothetical protein